MVFSSSIFILLFLPIVIAIYYNPVIKARGFRNVFLLLASLAFYAWGEPKYVFVMLATIAANWVLALKINKMKLIMAIVLDIGLLFVYKYLNFTAYNLGLPVPGIVLPIGISFFTFQMVSYMVDVYRGKAQPQKNFLNCALYISFFPQLIAGPIVRYADIESQINGRGENWDYFCEGLKRFTVGLGKKLLIANNCALAADAAFDTLKDGGEIGMAFAWLGAVAYTLQIYFDFSGYSDMAIGLGRMFGFKFLENFNYPYVSKSITEFWRRWHISLSGWFRDYVYIPLGGSRVGKSRLFFNLFVVWMLTGIWHGANWTFIAWGFGYFVFLALEKFILPVQKFPKFLAHIYAMLIVVFLWVVFRANSLGEAADYCSAMLGFGQSNFVGSDFWFYLGSLKIYLALGVLFSFPVVPWLKSKFPFLASASLMSEIAYVFLFLLCFVSVVKGGYNPFIYFNF
ncbi:D-alanyl-lipoteichoic acid acyltransferase [Fibrobacteria bacterium R8-3-H12]